MKRTGSRGRQRQGQATLEGTVRDVTQAGESVVETERGIVMIRGGLPGERVRVGVEQTRKGVLRGSLLARLSDSPDRVEPACAIAERCGGCPLMSLSQPAQRALKLQRVQRELSAVCAEGVSPRLEPVGEPLAYRRRVRLAFRRVGTEVLLGYRAPGSNRLVDAERCLVLDATLALALTRVRQTLSPELSGSGEIELAKVEPDHALVLVHCDTPASPAAYRAAEQLATQGPVVGVALRVGQGAAARFGHSEQQSLGSDGKPLHAPAGAFSQANADVNRRLAELVARLAEPRGAHVLELYAGHGNFSIGLAPEASSLTAVELDPEAAEACRRNLRERGLENAKVLTGDVSADLKVARAEVLVLDPPRSGAPGLAELVRRVRPARIVYVSCHMTTLGRDLRALGELGYRADAAFVLDMFPQTAHVEAVVRLRVLAS